VAIVMPPVVAADPSTVVASWATVTAAATALLETGAALPTVYCRHRSQEGVVVHGGVAYRFHRTDAALVREVRAAGPDVVHVHGIGWSRLLFRLRRVVAPIVVQHHGEPPFSGRTRWAHRLVRRWIAAYLFTGADFGQAQPWIDAKVIRRDATLCEVLEAASLLPPPSGEPIALEGDPAVLWVGRLIEGKDPLTALDAIALAAATLPDVHLHLLATDRPLEPAVRTKVASTPELDGRVHLHDPVPIDEIGRWYRGAPIFLSTSRREGSGYSLIEAVSCGCAPVVTSIPPHLAIVRSTTGTFLPGDAAAAAAALVQVSRHIERSSEPMPVDGRSLLSWESVAGQLLAAYRSAIPRLQ
jgi:glycosyltransferase involved in cell wall biosynthesis